MLNGIKIKNIGQKVISNEVVDVSDPNKVYIPLINNGVICECIVKKGKKVKKGTQIGVRKDIDFPILSSVSGTVIDIKKCLYLNGENVPCVVIENDKMEKVVKKVLKEDIADYKKEEFIELLRKCAIVGMGGSDFPTFLKYKIDANTLIVNAVECEPYISSDIMLIKLKAEMILESINAIMKINNIKKCYIAYKEKNTIIKDSFNKYIKKYKNISLYPLLDMYPMGWERHVVKSVLDLEYDRYPSEVGVIVNNVSTIFSIYKALKFQRNSTKRIITISGEGFSERINILAKVGTNMSSIINKLGKYKSDVRVIAGGPMMGISLKSDNVVVTNNLGAITILPNIDDEVHNCMGCGRCINACPAKICPVFILKNLNNVEELKKLNPEKCIECGACSYICPSKIGLRDAVKMAKKKVKKDEI